MDCVKVFGKSTSWCSTIFNDMVLYLIDRYRDRLEWDKERLSIEQLRLYSKTIEHACGVQNIWGFIDGTHRGISKPTIEQRAFYAGAKKEHGLRYQGIVTPDGIILLQGPWLGPTGDWRIWKESGIEDFLRQLFDIEGVHSDERLYLYGDPAYHPGFGIMGPFRPEGANFTLSPEEEAANVVMSGQRIVVEWAFGLVTKYWGFNSYKPAHKPGLSPVAGYYIVSVLLTNIQTCLKGGNQISDKYRLSPPSLERYLS